MGELFAATGAPLIVTDTATAETIKYASNAFLATKLSFVNAMAGLCEAVGADVRDLDARPGLRQADRLRLPAARARAGAGRACPRTPSALLRIAEDAGYDFALLRGAIAGNDEQLARVVAKVAAAAGGSVRRRSGRRLGAHLQGRHRRPPQLAGAWPWPAAGRAGAAVRAYDPTVDPGGRTRRPDLGGHRALCADPYEAARGAAVVVVLTEWDEFRWLDFAKVRDLMAVPSVVDARNLLDPAALRRLGFTYTGIGRP